jgi:RNA-directed DNA polymerase
MANFFHNITNNLTDIFNSSSDGKREGKSPGIDGVTASKFKTNLQGYLKRIKKELEDGSYTFSGLKEWKIIKHNGQYRILTIPTVKDRLVQRYIICKLKDLGFLKYSIISYGFNKKGTDKALNQAVKLRNDKPWVFKTDISKFFDEIDRDLLLKTIILEFKNHEILVPLINKVINCEIDSRSQDNSLEKEKLKHKVGLRQGMPLSPILANLFLNGFDEEMEKLGISIIRYVDDIIVFCSSRNECVEIEDIVRNELSNIRLKIPELGSIKEKTVIKDPRQPVIFLGQEIYKIKNTNNYGLKIPKYTINKMLQEVGEDCNNVINYQDISTKLDEKLKGYSGVYRETKNFNDFKEKFDRERNKIIAKLMKENLGEKIWKLLKDNLKALKFLGITT